MKGANFSSHRRAPTAGWQSQSRILVDTVIHDLQFKTISSPSIFAEMFILQANWAWWWAIAVPRMSPRSTALTLLHPIGKPGGARS